MCVGLGGGRGGRGGIRVDLHGAQAKFISTTDHGLGWEVRTGGMKEMDVWDGRDEGDIPHHQTHLGHR